VLQRARSGGEIGGVWSRLVLVGTVLAACGDAGPRERASTPLEAEIERELGPRAGAPIRVRCVALPPGCTAVLPDRRTVAIQLRGTRDKIEWRLDGLLVRAEPVERYLRDTLADLGAPQVARCGARIQVVPPGARLACALERGGTAFVTLRADGSMGFEIELDPVAGAARGEVVTGTRDAELVQMSKQLESGESAAEGGD